MRHVSKIRSAAVLALALCAGCASYFEVTDSRNGHKYYTDKVNRKDSGLIVFKDASNGSEVTLPASSIATITKEEFETGKHTKDAAPTPMMAPMMAPTTSPAK